MAFTIPIITSLGASVGSSAGLGMLGLGATNAIGAATLGVGYFAGKKVLKGLSPDTPNYSGSAANQRNDQAVKDLQAAQSTASAEAANAIAKRRRAGTQTTFTNPLGSEEEANVSRKTLLGE